MKGIKVKDCPFSRACVCWCGESDQGAGAHGAGRVAGGLDVVGGETAGLRATSSLGLEQRGGNRCHVRK